jgi:hypothetical protein
MSRRDGQMENRHQRQAGEQHAQEESGRPFIEGLH